MPDGFETSEGNEIRPNAFQQFLLESFRRATAFVHEVADGEPYALLINGDLIDGIHHRSTQVISPKWEDHVLAAIQVLEPMTRKAAKVYITRGTECHTLDIEDAIGKALGSQCHPETGRPVFDRLKLKINGTTIVARHHFPTSARGWTQATALGSMLVDERNSAIMNGEEVPQVLIGAHRHTGAYLRAQRGLVVTTHPWQGMTRFTHKVVSNARCQPGVFVLDWRGLPSGEIPTVHDLTITAPHEITIQI